MNKYFVFYTRHNAKTDAWAYKFDLGTDDIDEAINRHYALMAEYSKGDFDMLTVKVMDAFGNEIKSDHWTPHTKPVEVAEW